MKITEEDIFNYVLFPEEISSEKRDYIKKNEQLFLEQIEFCSAFLNSENDNISYSQVRDMADKIIGEPKIIILYPVVKEGSLTNNHLTLAAATTGIANKSTESITYTDENSKYLVRIVIYKNKGKLYFFSKEKNTDIKLKITLLPTEEICHINSPSQSVDILSTGSIEKILIEEE